MANVMSGGAAWLRDQLQDNVSELITYDRGGDTVDILATIGETVFITVNELNFQVELRVRDFIIDPADLILSALRVDPAEGDRIFLPEKSIVIEYEVLRLAGEPVFRSSDRFGNLIRVHAKERERV